MKKLTLLILLSSTLSYGALVELSPSTPIKASEINNNFSYIKSILNARNGQISFSTFTSGELITKEGLEIEFQKGSFLGISIEPLSGGQIKSSEINDRFNSLVQGANNFNDTPVLTTVSPSITMNFNTVYSGSVSGTDTVGSGLTYSLLAPATNGVVALNSTTGTFTYTPTTNFYGEDSFSIRASDGSLFSNPINFSASINGSGLIKVNNIRYYYNNQSANSCLAYMTTNSGALTYTGETGSGYYRINTAPSGTATVYCDMETQGGGWTLYARFSGTSTTSSHFGSADFGTLQSTSLDYSFTTSKLGVVNKVMAKSPAGNRVWNFSGNQVMNVPNSGNYTVNLAGTGDDGCVSNGISYNDSGCWGGRRAGPAISNSTGYINSACANLGNWDGGDRFYGRADQGLSCVPYGKWNNTPSEGIYSPTQEWYLK